MNNSVPIPLTQGKVALISPEDVEMVTNKGLWTAHKHHTGAWYAYTRDKVTRTIIRLHRFIIGAIPSEHVDHKDRNGLNNCRENLRKVTLSQSAANRGKPKNNTSGFKGVYLTRSGKFNARIGHDGKSENLGTFKTPEEAAAVYDARAKEVFGEFACTNGTANIQSGSPVNVHESMERALKLDFNKRIRMDNSTGYIGVTRTKGKFQSSVTLNGAFLYLGRFESAEEAAICHDIKAIEVHGNRARLNFERSR